MKVQLVRAWPRHHDLVEIELAEGATVADALAAAGWDGDPEVRGYAVFGQAVMPDAALAAGDRVELLRPLTIDPKEARRRRAEARPLRKG